MVESRGIGAKAQSSHVHRCGELWCYTPMAGSVHMSRGAKRKEKSTVVKDASVRATISFPSEIYRTLEEIAHQKKVSLAWVVRDAAEQYVASRWPLFKGNG